MEAETTEEKRIKRINQLKEKIAKEQALLNKAKKKERDGQLIAAGILMERIYLAADEEGKKHIRDSARRHFENDERNLRRVEGLCDRLDPKEKK